MKGKNTHIKEYQNFINEGLPPEEEVKAREILRSSDPDTQKIVKFVKKYLFEKNGITLNDKGRPIAGPYEFMGAWANGESILEELQRKMNIVISAMGEGLRKAHPNMVNNESKK
jgi:hypothetical protein